MQKKYKKNIFKNGLRVISVPMQNTRAVTVLVMVGAGTKYETKDTNGISHFLEHMFFKGTKKRPNTLKVAETLDRIGGEYNAFTSKEFTGYWAKVECSHLDLALDWVSDILLNSQFKEKEIEKEKGVIIEEFNMYLDTPIALIGDLWEKLLYGDQPAGWMTLGRKENILRFRRKDFIRYLKTHYSSKNTVICVAGNLDSADVEKKVRKYFSKIQDIQPSSKPSVVEKQTVPNSLVYFKETDQTHIALGVRGYSLFHKERFAQILLAKILGGFMSSRLFISVREKRGLAYYIRTVSESTTDTGYLVTFAGIDNRNVGEAIKIILKEYNDLKRKRISNSELKKAKDNLRGSILLSLESSDVQASFYATQEILTGKVLTPEEKIDQLEKVTPKDIQKVARAIFKPENLNLVLIGPFREKQRFNNLLKI
ncbi:insulinase family protein [bacterium]|nr:insulinase family protein [bacterium]